MTDEEVQAIYDYLHENYEYRDGELIKKTTNKPAFIYSQNNNSIIVALDIKRKRYSAASMIYLFHYKKFFIFFNFKDKNILNFDINNLIPGEKRRSSSSGAYKLKDNKYKAVIFINDNYIHLGIYINEEYAIQAFQFAKELFNNGVQENEIQVRTKEKFDNFLVTKLRKLPTGVCKVRQKYTASLTINCKQRHLGTFNTIEEAHSAYLKANEEKIRQIKQAPVEGSIPKNKIKHAVKSVSNHD